MYAIRQIKLLHTPNGVRFSRGDDKKNCNANNYRLATRLNLKTVKMNCYKNSLSSLNFGVVAATKLPLQLPSNRPHEIWRPRLSFTVIAGVVIISAFRFLFSNCRDIRMSRERTVENVSLRLYETNICGHSAVKRHILGHKNRMKSVCPCASTLNYICRARCSLGPSPFSFAAYFGSCITFLSLFLPRTLFFSLIWIP